MNLEERVRRLAGAGGDLSSVRRALDQALRLSIVYDAAAIATVDPATMLCTSCFTSGLPASGEAERERALFTLEFVEEDVNRYVELANSGQFVGRLHHATAGDLSRSRRWTSFLSHFEFIDEMRAVLVSREMVWGSVTLYRKAPHPPLSEDDERVVRSALTAMADVFRLAMLRAAVESAAGIERPPGIIVVSPDGDVTAVTGAAQRWLEAIDDRDRVPSAVRSVAAAAAAGDGLANAAFPAPDGGWVMLHASPLGGEGDGVGIIVEGARPVALSGVIAGAYGFTARERQVTALAAQGHSTKKIASALGISSFTVQDHLKAVFDKVGVQSRAELVAMLYVRHYEPRRRAGAVPSPYGWYLDDHAA